MTEIESLRKENAELRRQRDALRDAARSALLPWTLGIGRDYKLIEDAPREIFALREVLRAIEETSDGD